MQRWYITINCYCYQNQVLPVSHLECESYFQDVDQHGRNLCQATANIQIRMIKVVHILTANTKILVNFVGGDFH